MARITYVKKAQQRYATVPVIDEATGQPKQTPVIGRNGQQKTTKRGRPVFMTVTRQDRTKPLANLRCDYPGCDIDGGEIKPGTAYKHISPKSGPYGGRQLNRHQQHPDWQVWEYSSSLSARTAQIAYDFRNEISNVETPDDVQSALQSAAESIREIAEEKRESASNIEEGFGHATEKSDELNDIAEQLDSWADEVENADVPDLPDPEEQECEECGGTGHDESDEELECDECSGTGYVTPDEPTDDQLDDWCSEVEDATSIVDECPV